MITREQALALKAQYRSYAAAHRATGIPESTLKSAANRVSLSGYSKNPLKPDKPHIIGPRATASIAKEAVQDRIHTVVAIGDHHDKPGRDKTRALWMGRFCAEHSPDAVVSIGDWASLDSLSTHEAPGSANDALRPAFYEELESLDESLSLFNREFQAHGEVPLLHTHGNHEFRAWRSADRQPKLNGDAPIRLEEVFGRYGWTCHPFGQFLDLYGVDFVHVPLSIMGKELGGENVERSVANKSLRSTVFGHTHRANVLNVSKLGQERSVQVVNLGTSLPYGVVEKYAKMSQTGWTYGLFSLRILDGQILSAKHYDMLELEERYGD